MKIPYSIVVANRTSISFEFNNTVFHLNNNLTITHYDSLKSRGKEKEFKFSFKYWITDKKHQ